MTTIALASAILGSSVAGAQQVPGGDDTLNAVLWAQTSIEAQANALAAYALAKIRLDEALADPTWTAATEQTGDYKDLPPAIILDVDETILNTSPYQARGIVGNVGFDPKTWTRYVNSKIDPAIPGAVDFTQYAASKGVKVFYVTNRTKEEEAATTEHLKTLGFPMGDNVDTMLTAKEQPDWTSAKGTRRTVIAKDYRILLLIGDNFGDFSDAYKATLEERQKSYDAASDRWARSWIVIANPMYGSFETSPYGNDYKVAPEERHKLKVQALKPWQAE